METEDFTVTDSRRGEGTVASGSHYSSQCVSLKLALFPCHCLTFQCKGRRRALTGTTVASDRTEGGPTDGCEGWSLGRLCSHQILALFSSHCPVQLGARGGEPRKEATRMS